VTVVARNQTVDLAVLTIDASPDCALIAEMNAKLNYGDEVLLAGYPQHAPGKKLYIANGNIVAAQETVSAVQRFQISARIIRGNSGGPVLDQKGRVIGVAITGDEDVKTESHQPYGVIRIDMLDSLKIETR
jgi:S1-C subfamily serine protease